MDWSILCQLFGGYCLQRRGNRVLNLSWFALIGTRTLVIPQISASFFCERHEFFHDFRMLIGNIVLGTNICHHIKQKWFRTLTLFKVRVSAEFFGVARIISRGLYARPVTDPWHNSKRHHKAF